MVLASSRRYSTGQLADTDEDRKVAKPDEDEAVDETGRPTTVRVRKDAL